MDFLSDLLPGVPSLELDPTNPLQNVTFLQNAFAVTFLTSLAAQAVSNILGESDKNSAQNQKSKTQNIIFQSQTSQDQLDTDWRMIPAVG